MFNCCGLVITTNHKAGGIFLPADDRRHYVAWSTLTKDDFVRRLLEPAVGLVRQGRPRPRRRLPGRARPRRVRPQGAAAADAGILGHRRRRHAAEDAELADVLDELERPRRGDAGADQAAATRRFLRVARRPQEPARRFRTGWSAAAIVRFATTKPTTGCGGSAASARPSTSGPTSLPRTAAGSPSGCARGGDPWQPSVVVSGRS